jgi:hypothetical protein
MEVCLRRASLSGEGGNVLSRILLAEPSEFGKEDGPSGRMPEAR